MTLNRRPVYLSQFAKSLLRNHKADSEQDLIEAQELVEELAKYQPNALETLSLQVDVYRARNQVEKAVELIQASAQRPNLQPAAFLALASLADKLGRADVAEPLFRQYASLPNNPDGAVALALFLGRRGRMREALDVVAPLWAHGIDADKLSAACLDVLSSSEKRADSSQFDRIAGWLETAIKEKKGTPLLVFNLASIRSEQMRYDDARSLYQSVIKQAPGSALTPTIVNRLLAMAYNNMAWLTALKGGEGRGALADVNHAIDLIGPQADLLDTRGMIHLRLKQTNDAINDLQMAVKNAPSASKLFHLAQAYFQANDKEKAREYLKQAQAKGLADRNRAGSGAHPFARAAGLSEVAQRSRNVLTSRHSADRHPVRAKLRQRLSLFGKQPLLLGEPVRTPWPNRAHGTGSNIGSPVRDRSAGNQSQGARPGPAPLPPPASRNETVSWPYSGVRTIPPGNRGCKSAGCVCFSLPVSEVGHGYDAFAVPNCIRTSVCYPLAGRCVDRGRRGRQSRRRRQCPGGLRGPATQSGLRDGNAGRLDGRGRAFQGAADRGGRRQPSPRATCTAGTRAGTGSGLTNAAATGRKAR